MRLLDARKNADDTFVEASSGLRDRNLAGRPMQKPGVQLVLKAPDPLRYDRRCHSERSCGERHAARLHDACEYLKVVQILHSIVSHMANNLVRRRPNVAFPGKISCIADRHL